MIAQSAEARVKVRRIGNDHAAIASGAEILGGIKADAGDVGERAGAASFICGADGLGVVFDKRQFVVFCDFAQRVHVCREAVKVNSDDGLGFWRNSAADVCGVEIQSDAVYVGENGASTKNVDGAGSRHESQGWDQHFVAWINIAGAEGEDQGVGPAGDPYAVSDSAKGSQFVFKGCALFTEDQLLGSENAVDGFANFGANLCVLAGEVKLIDGFEGG